MLTPLSENADTVKVPQGTYIALPADLAELIAELMPLVQSPPPAIQPKEVIETIEATGGVDTGVQTLPTPEHSALEETAVTRPEELTVASAGVLLAHMVTASP
jgi:hypothetical protein